MIIEKLKIITGPDLSNLKKNRDLTIQSETIHNRSGITLTMFITYFDSLGAFLMNN